MEEKKRGRINLSTFFLMLAILVIIIMGIFIYKLYNEKITQIEKAAELQEKVNSLNNGIINLQDKIDSISDTINTENQTKELSDLEKQELFNKAVKQQSVLIDNMVLNKNFSEKTFTDEEIILILPDSSEGKIFSVYDNDSGFYSKASITDVEKSAQKLFGKTINVKAAHNNDSIRIINEDVIVEVRSGVGVLNAELISIDAINDNEYTIKFKFNSGSGNTETYKITVDYIDGNIIYKSFEK